MNWIFETTPTISFTVLRLGLAIAFFAHSTQQIFGWFDGRGLNSVLANWKEKYGIPVPIGLVGMFTEFFGSFALLFGFLTRPFALGLAIFMAGCMQKNPFGKRSFLLRRAAGGGGGEGFFVGF